MPQLDEFVLDFLDPEEQHLVKDMLKAIVEHPDIYNNGFSVTRNRDGTYEYFLGNNQRPGPFRNRQQLSTDITGLLIHRGLVGRKVNPQWTDNTRSFTEDMLAWYRQFGGVMIPDEIRKRIGRSLQEQIHSYRKFDITAVAAEVGVPADSIKREANVLLAAKLIEAEQGPGQDYVRLAQPTGVLWAAADFPPLASLLNAHQTPIPVPTPRPHPPSKSQQATAEIRDVFVSHASEDKEEIARPLTDALIRNGLRVWFDDYELQIGDSLRRKIDEGLTSSQYGVVIFSEPFFAKSWPQHELDGMVAKINSGTQNILPIWHKITKDEMLAYSPSLADKVARSTSVWTIQQIADEITGVVKSPVVDEHSEPQSENH